MNPRIAIVLALLVLGGGWKIPLASAQVSRFALVAGNNRGQNRERSLRFAESDARRFADLLVDLGGFERDDVVLLTGASADGFRTGLARVRERVAAAVPSRTPRALVVVYFSGHSDGIHLEFGSDLLPYAELRQLVEQTGAQIKIAFIDSCKSGGLTAVKGGRPGPAFDLVLTDQMDATGTAIVTSSAAGENAQESGELQGSFYTHYLLSGLRGAADRNRDHKVTLAEVYAYAYDKTVVQTARTLGGTQHPTYDYQIAGRGKVVLTDLTRTRSSLRFGADTRGRFLVLGAESEEVVAEVSKAFGSHQQISLPAGAYRVIQHRDGLVFSQTVEVPGSGSARVVPDRMIAEGSLVASAKSGRPGRSPWGVFVHYGLVSGALKNFAAVHQASAGLKVDIGPVSVFPRFTYGQANVEDDKLRYDMHMYAAETYVTWRFEYSVLDLFAGVSLGVSYGAQRMPNEDSFSGTVFSYGAVGGIDLPLWEGLALQLFWEAGGTMFKLDGEMANHVLLKGVVGLGYQF